MKDYGILLLVGLLLPTVAFAAFNDVTLTTSTNVSVGGYTLNVTGSSAVVQSIVVNDSNLSVTLSSGSSIQISSPTYQQLSVDVGTFTTSNNCAGSTSVLTLASSGPSGTVTVTPTATICSTPVVPDVAVSLAQYKSNGITPLATGAITNQTTVILSMGMSSANASDTLTPQVEVEPLGTAFTNSPNYTGSSSAYAGSPVTGTVTVSTLVDAQYHWQARVSNSAGQGGWTSYGGNAESASDFQIDATAPTNEDTVFASSVFRQGGATVTVVSSGDSTNAIWFAPSGTTNFSAGSTMTTAGGTATSITAPATQGTYKLYVIDSAGNISSASIATLTVDNTAPGAPGTPSTTSPTNSANQVWLWTAAVDSLSGVANYAWRVTTSLGVAVTNGTTSLLTVTTHLTEGLYNFFVKAIDNAGNQGSESSGSVTVDTTAPSLSEVTPVSSPTNNSTPSYVFSSSEAGTISYGGDCTSSTTSASSGNNTISFSSLADGAHTNCTVTVTDAAGNASSALNVSAFTVDTSTVTPSPSSDAGSGGGGSGGGSTEDVAPTTSLTISGSGGSRYSQNVVTAGKTFAFNIKVPDADQVHSVTVRIGGKTYRLKRNSSTANPSFLAQILILKPGTYLYSTVIDYGVTVRRTSGTIVVKGIAPVAKSSPVPPTATPIVSPKVAPLARKSIASTVESILLSPFQLLKRPIPSPTPALRGTTPIRPQIAQSSAPGLSLIGSVLEYSQNVVDSIGHTIGSAATGVMHFLGHLW